MVQSITAIIVDDEADSREILRQLLQESFPELLILAEAGNVETASDLINTYHPQLVFLDIQMPRANGFSLLKKYNPVPFEVIFVTSYDQYAITAIKFSALDYLLKPIELSDLKSAVAKAKVKLREKQDNSAQIINLLQSFDVGVEVKKVAVHFNDEVKLIRQTEILFLEALGRYTKIYLLDGSDYLVAKTLKEFEFYFGHGSGFIRISKSFLLNVHHIKAYSKGEPCMITLANELVFEVSRRKKQEVLELIKPKN